MEAALENVTSGLVAFLVAILVSLTIRWSTRSHEKSNSLEAQSYSREAPSNDPETPLKPGTRPKQYQTYRIRGVPKQWDEEDLSRCLTEKLKGTSWNIKSLALEVHRHSLTATATPVGECKAELSLPLTIQLNRDQILTVDNDFLGITTLIFPRLENHKLDVIAVSGLGGHAFGSFKQRHGEYMWLLNSLPHELKDPDSELSLARIIIYGHDSTVAHSDCMQDLDDLSFSFRESLHRLASTETVAPIILVGHSLGGLIIKRALTSMMPDIKKGSNQTEHLARAISGIVFFGVPHDGMELGGLKQMAGDNLNRFLVESIGRLNSKYLQGLRWEFDKLLEELRRIEIFCFYETKRSRIPSQNDDGKWSMNGRKEVLVTQSSATHCRASERNDHHICPINLSHSEMVKFGPHSHEYYNQVLGIFQKMARNAISSVSEHINAQNDTQLDEVTKECLKSLAFEGMDFRANQIEEAARNTCTWLVEHIEYKNWLSADRGVLWIKGNPGSGKSTLLRYALDNRRKINIMTGREPFIVSFFFHGRGTELQKTRMGFLRSVLHQILSQQRAALRDLVVTYQDWRDTKRKGNEEMRWQENQLARYLRSSIRNPLMNCPVLLYVDALDESGKENAVALAAEFSTLIDEAAAAGNELHICFTCRHYPILGENYPFEICLDKENKDDISTYVRNRLSSDDFPPSILRLIIDGAKGVFMWARLVIDEALQLHREGDNEETIKQHVRSIPPELDDIYVKIIEDIKGKDDSLKLIQWICFSVRPLSLDEMRWAMVMDDDSSRTTLQQYERSNGYIRDNEQMKKRLKTLSCGLTETVTSYGGSKIQFIHQSVTDFFPTKGLLILEESLRKGEPKPSVRYVAGMANLVLARSCVQIVSMNDAIDYLREHELPHFFYYASFWCRHLQNIQAHDIVPNMVFELLPRLEGSDWNLLDTLSDGTITRNNTESESALLKILGRRTSKQLNRDFDYTWIQLATEFSFEGLLSILVRTDVGVRDIDKKFRSGKTPLMHAANCNADIFKIIFGTGKVNLAARDCNGLTALTYAARAGNDIAVGLLITTGSVDIEARDEKGKTPFLYAAENGRESVVRMLLNTGKVNIEVRDEKSKTPFLYAAENGRESVVRMLLDTGKVDIESSDKKGKTPFLHAAKNGRESVVRMLLDTGKVDIEARDRKGKTPFLLAAEKNEVGVLKLLISTGKVDILARDNENRTALLLAIGPHSEKTVEVLLGTSLMEVDAEDSEGRTALRLAAEYAPNSGVRPLLETGKANINAKDNSGITPLSAAACSRKGLEVVELLLGTGEADIDTRDQNYRTPLIHAARAGSVEVIGRLLDGKADISATDKDGCTAICYAEETCEFNDVMRRLRTMAEVKRLRAKWLGGQSPMG